MPRLIDHGGDLLCVFTLSKACNNYHTALGKIEQSTYDGTAPPAQWKNSGHSEIILILLAHLYNTYPCIALLHAYLHLYSSIHVPRNQSSGIIYNNLGQIIHYNNACAYQMLYPEIPHDRISFYYALRSYIFYIHRDPSPPGSKNICARNILSFKRNCIFFCLLLIHSSRKSSTTSLR